jgi:tetratricopeptide (TPR) repeat protein
VTRPLFEQYKEALRRGHLAARSGNVDEALTAYGEAGRLAPDRAAPHTSSATALHNAGRREEAYAAFERALAIAPDDEATLRARAAAHESIGRAASAAADLERLAEALEAAGRRADALAAARRALALTATAARRRLVARLEAPEADGPPPVRSPAPALPSRSVVPPRPTVAAPPSRERAPEPDVATDADVEGRPESADAEIAPVRRRLAPALPQSPDDEAPALSVEAPSEFEPEPDRPPARAAATLEAAERVPTPEPEGPSEPLIPWPAIDLPSAPPPPLVGPPPNVDVLLSEAHALIDGGDLLAARNLMLTAVAVHRAAGRSDAALDVCLQLLALAPGDAHVHLAIASLQLDRGWQTLATEKIALLLRLTALTGDTQAEADVHALAAERLRDEPAAGAARP